MKSSEFITEGVNQQQVEDMVEHELGNIMTNAEGYFVGASPMTTDWIAKKMSKLSDAAWNGLIQEPILQQDIMNTGKISTDAILKVI